MFNMLENSTETLGKHGYYGPFREREKKYLREKVFIPIAKNNNI